jgi:hypothetical protein
MPSNIVTPVDDVGGAAASSFNGRSVDGNDQMFTVPSRLPDANTRPTGEKAIAVTVVKWLTSYCSSSPVSVSHSFISLSKLAEATNLPSEE